MNQPESPLPLVSTILLLLLLLASLAHGETVVDSTFTPPLAPNAVVNDLALDVSGTLVAGGAFAVQNHPARNIVRLEQDGSADAAFAVGSGTDGEVSRVVVEGTDILLGGKFGSVNGNARGGLAKLSSNGSLVAGFGATRGGNGSVTALLPWDGDALVGGSFTTFNGSSAPYLADVSPDNTVSSPLALNPAIEAGVYALARQADGKVLVSGIFNTGRGTETLVRLNADGSLDSTFSAAHGPVLYANAIAALSNGRILLGGVENSDGEGFLRRLLPDGSVDASFAESSFGGSVYSIAVQPNGRILVGGSFQSADGASHQSLARFNSDGTLDSTFNVAVSGVVKAIALNSDNAIYIGGVFNAVNDQPSISLARLVEDSAPVFHASSTQSGTFSATLKTEPGKTYVIETSIDLQNWTDFSTNVATNAGLQITDTTVAQQPHRFFRARLVE